VASPGTGHAALWRRARGAEGVEGARFQRHVVGPLCAVLQRNGAQLARRHVGMAAQVGQRAIQVSVAGLAGGIEGAAHAQVQVAAARQLQAAIGRTRPVPPTASSKPCERTLMLLS
jgi:hypothetical protein